MTATGNVHRLPNRDAALKALYTDIAAKNLVLGDVGGRRQRKGEEAKCSKRVISVSAHTQ
jgi:hypothetical protein